MKQKDEVGLQGAHEGPSAGGSGHQGGGQAIRGVVSSSGGWTQGHQRGGLGKSPERWLGHVTREVHMGYERKKRRGGGQFIKDIKGMDTRPGGGKEMLGFAKGGLGDSRLGR